MHGWWDPFLPRVFDPDHVLSGICLTPCSAIRVIGDQAGPSGVEPPALLDALPTWWHGRATLQRFPYSNSASGENAVSPGLGTAPVLCSPTENPIGDCSPPTTPFTRYGSRVHIRCSLRAAPSRSRRIASSMIWIENPYPSLSELAPYASPDEQRSFSPLGLQSTMSSEALLTRPLALLVNHSSQRRIVLFPLR
jgi:hypothetical protein